jgi:hypothetical protein
VFHFQENYSKFNKSKEFYWSLTEHSEECRSSQRNKRTHWKLFLSQPPRPGWIFYPFLFSFLFFLGRTRVWTQGFAHAKQVFYLFSTLPIHFALVALEMGVSQTICPSWPQTSIPPISASHVARITSMRHQTPAGFSIHFKVTFTKFQQEEQRLTFQIYFRYAFLTTCLASSVLPLVPCLSLILTLAYLSLWSQWMRKLTIGSSLILFFKRQTV